MNSTSPTCLKQDSAASELAALATIGRHYGMPVTLPAIRRLTGFGKQSLDGVQLLAAAGRCGFRAIPLEGEFHQLPEVPLPNIVIFRDAQYQVLFEVDESSALTGDTATGEVRRLSRNEFGERWTGEVFQVQPNEEFEAAGQSLRRVQSPWWKLAGVLGMAPLAPARMLFAIALCAWASAFFWASPLAQLTGVCLLISLWMAGWPRGCSRCGNSASLAGSLPLPWLGAGLYTAITAAVLLNATQWYWPGLLAAAGAHLALAVILLRNRMICYPCLGLAVTVWIALAAALGRVSAGAEVVLVPLAAVVALLAITGAGRFARFEARHEMLALAERVAAEKPVLAEGQVRLVVYSWKTCPNCLFFKNVVRPALTEEFGDALVIEERDASTMKVAVPLFFVTGITRMMLASVATEEMLSTISEAIQTAADPASARVGQLGGFHIVGLTAEKV